MLCAGCSVLGAKDDTASVTFCIDGAMAQKIAEETGESLPETDSFSSRAVPVSEGLYVDISLKGGFEASQTIPIFDGATAVFAGIPVGTELYAETSVYKPNKNKRIAFYTGTSEKITIHEGENQLDITLEKANPQDDPSQGEPSQDDPSQDEPVFSTTIFVSSTGSDETGNGTEEKPLGSISAATGRMKDANLDYTIFVDGEISGGQMLTATLSSDSTNKTATAFAKSVTICGKTGADTDILNGGFTDAKRGTTLSISTKVPVTVKNLKITGGYVGQGSGGGIKLSSGATVTAENCVISGNTGNSGGSASGGGVYVAQGTCFTMNGGKICGNTGDGVCVYDGSTGGEFTMNAGEISKNSGYGVFTVYSTGNNSQFIFNGGTICENEGNGIYACGKVFMNGGTICGNKASRGSGVYVYAASVFSIGGDAFIADDNDVYLNDNRVITISGALTHKSETGVSPVAKIIPSAYKAGREILTLAKGADTTIEAEYAKFTVVDYDDTDNYAWSVTSAGTLQKTAIYQTELYVSDSGSSIPGSDENGDGTEAKPFGSIAAALTKITETAKSNLDFTITIRGTFAENVIIQDIPAKSILIQGASEGGADKISGNGIAGYPFESYGTVSLKNVAVAAHGNLGANIHAGTLTLENGASIICTAAEDSGSYGVYVSGTVIMNGNAEISGFKQKSGYTVYLQGESAKLVMNDNAKIADGKAGEDSYSAGGGVYVGSGTLEMNGNAEISGCNSYSGGGVYVKSGSVTMNGNAKISGCSATYGGGVYISCESGSAAQSGSLVMNGSATIENCSAKVGGGIYVTGSSFHNGMVTMNDTTVISNCSGSKITGTNDRESAGGVDVDEYGAFTMNGSAKITECSGASTGAGGVYLKGTFTMNGGEISKNNAPYNSAAGAQNGVGGIYLHGSGDSSKAVFTMSGGKICDNNGNKYGGVSMSGYTVFDMQGGTISGNKANAANSDKVHGLLIGWTKTLTDNVIHPGTFRMSGDAVVASDNDVRISDNTTLTIGGSLTGNTPVATLSFDTYQADSAVIALASGVSTTTLAQEAGKFVVKPKTADGATIQYLLDANGKLREKKSAPDAVGDIVFADGSAISYTDGLALSDLQKADAVCIIFYAGTETGKLGKRTLGVGLRQTTSKKWCLGTSHACVPVSNVYQGKTISALECTPSKGDEISSSSTTFTGDIDGSNNWQTLKDFLAENGGDDTDTEGNYPAWEWANGYGAECKYTGSFEDGWYLPTVAEGAMLCAEKYTVRKALEAAGGTTINQTYYWTSTTAGSMARTFNPSIAVSDGTAAWDRDTNSWTVLAIRSF